MSEYLSLVMTLILAFGISFELPVLLLLLVRVGIISAQSLADKRRYAVVAVVAFAGLVTPPDVLSQLSLAIPMYILYESSIWIGYAIERGKAKREAEEEAEGGSEEGGAAPAAAPAAAASAPVAEAAPAPTPETDFNQSR
jgi:sec-independent protein translocase protein TatC